MLFLPLHKRHSFSSFILLSILLTVSCSTNKVEKSILYTIKFQTQGDINNSAPLKLNILLLNDPDKFNQADIGSLQTNTRSVLANSVIYQRSIFLLPRKEENDISITVNAPSTEKYIAIWAEYQNITDKQWRLIIPLSSFPTASYLSVLNPFSSSEPYQLITVTSHGLQIPSDK
ncbi:type VI secretion system lipoprotein TssJ [Photorhabdus laumondii]|uniref:Type VI secretion system lipoprotein TssJ n=1 Tax=Photorhabdus laumondii subsp. clarkei TaxID=2029685 RepID=A0A329VAL1_9GAMM|nr:type VI secretion system lipoprotein TssJ [Photorhabdus laumondii]PQQ36013.1 type VI secretion system lipoprotein TssJ [Photorhabdus luminescens]RAW83242.1 type VI secretion system lipoprotein TssJ [Photorhabdus laumondii subsp. clarkei]